MTTATLILVMLTALFGFLSASLGYLNNGKIKETAVKTEQVHVLVNSQLTETVNRVSQLVLAMEKAGVAVPPRASEKEDT